MVGKISRDLGVAAMQRNTLHYDQPSVALDERATILIVW
jgi:hypothetical protein